MLNYRHYCTAIAYSLGVDPDEVLGKSRKEEIVRARHIVWWLLVKKQGVSFCGLARQIGRDHTSIMHGVQSIENARKHEQWLGSFLSELAVRFASRPPAARVDLANLAMRQVLSAASVEIQDDEAVLTDAAGKIVLKLPAETIRECSNALSEVIA
jgi:hypothetical protein